MWLWLTHFGPGEAVPEAVLEAVSEAVLEAIVADASLAPSSFNLQHARYVLATSEEDVSMPTPAA